MHMGYVSFLKGVSPYFRRQGDETRGAIIFPRSIQALWQRRSIRQRLVGGSRAPTAPIVGRVALLVLHGESGAFLRRLRRAQFREDSVVEQSIRSVGVYDATLLKEPPLQLQQTPHSRRGYPKRRVCCAHPSAATIIESTTAMSPESRADLLNAHAMLPRNSRFIAALLGCPPALHFEQRPWTCKLVIPTQSSGWSATPRFKLPADGGRWSTPGDLDGRLDARGRGEGGGGGVRLSSAGAGPAPVQ